MGWLTWFIGFLDHNLCNSFQTSYLGTFDDFLGARNLDRHTENIGFVNELLTEGNCTTVI